MTVFNRISDIINANLNSILEQAEDPEKLVRLITQEMEETLVEVRSASARHLADKKQITQSIRAYQQESRVWESKAELAINKGRDDLAKAALKEKTRFDDAISSVEGDLIHINISIEKLKEDAVLLETKLQHARARQKALIVRGQTAESRIKVKRQLNDLSFDDAFNRFESYERKLDEMEGEIEAFDLGSKSLSAEIHELEHDEHLNLELNALKSRMEITQDSPQVQRA
jgi:phage shock protein A